MRLIDAISLINRITKKYGLTEVILDIDESPTIDAVEVVRCKDCRYGYCDKLFYFNDSYRCNIHDDGFEIHDADWYCPDGERRETNDR